MSDVLQTTLKRYALQSSIGSEPLMISLKDSVSRMQLVLIFACRDFTIESEHKNHNSITDSEYHEIKTSFQHFLQHAKNLDEMLAYGVTVSMLEDDFGKLYKRILEIAGPWKVIWENIFNVSMINCTAHPVYGYPVKIQC